MMPPPPPLLLPRRAERDLADGLVGGVAAGLARHVGLPVLAVRAGFVLTSALSGLGVVLYAAFWLVLPASAGFNRDAPGLESASRGGRRPSRGRRWSDTGPILVLAVMAVGALFAVEAVLGRGTVFWPLTIGVAGIALLWRQADEAQRARWVDASGRVDPARVLLGDRGGAAYLRLVVGFALVVLAAVFFALRSGSLNVARDVGIAVLLGVVGLGLVVGPWLLRLAGELAAERAERVRSQERADVAAHLHDSVLQTLALIQQSSADPARVAKLARAQERDLRAWLFTDGTDGTDAAGAPTLAGGLRAAAAEVEDAWDVVVDVVTVGDPAGDVVPLVAAAREAITNAAKHAGVPQVDVYAETSGPDGATEVFVRDRGVGFDPAAVEPDRHGVRDSIVERMRRHGGTAEVRSTPGAGTEVRLWWPRQEADDE